MNIENFQVTAILHSFMLHFKILAFWGNYVFVFPWTHMSNFPEIFRLMNVLLMWQKHPVVAVFFSETLPFRWRKCELCELLVMGMESSTASSAQQVCWHWLPSNMAPRPEKFESMLIEVWDGKPLINFLLMFTLFSRFQVLIILHKCCECRGKPTPRKAVKKQFGSLYYDHLLISSICCRCTVGISWRDELPGLGPPFFTQPWSEF